MKHRPALLACLCAIAYGLPPAVHAQETMSNAQFEAAKDELEARYKADKQRCDALKDNAEDVCEEEAQARLKVGEAELRHRRSGKDEDARKLEHVRAETAYEVAKEKCDEKSGNDKDVCLAEAKATQAKSDAATTR
jgi:hypothetical protein